MDKLSAALAVVENQLADNDIYSDENKAQLTKLLAEQAKIKPELNDVEESLLFALEELESKEQHFAETGELL